MVTLKPELSLPTGGNQSTNAVLLGLSMFTAILFGQVELSKAGGVISGRYSIHIVSFKRICVWNVY